MIEIENLSVSYGKHNVIDGMNACFNKGKLTAIIGPNGCGKSTLLKAILGILPIRQGRVSIDGIASTSLNSKGIAKKLSYLPQIKPIPDMTAGDLVLQGRFPHLSFAQRYSEKDQEIALSSMKQLNIEDLYNEPVSTLSGGMRQNVFIAMALAQDTDYILMDEPTTHLDVGNSIKLMALLNELSKNGKGIIAVLHDITLALQYADNIIVMNDGKVIIADSTKSVFNSGVIDRVFDVKIHSVGNHYYYESR